MTLFLTVTKAVQVMITDREITYLFEIKSS